MLALVAALGLAACGDTVGYSDGSGDKIRGKELFTKGCGSCHTLADAGTTGTVGPNLDQAKPPKDLVVDRVTNGQGAMPPFKGTLSDAEIQAVADYVLGRPEAEEFLDKYVALVDTVARGYLTEGKRFMTIAIGCTGGKHRSVAMTEEIAARLQRTGVEAKPTHRDLGRE